MTRYATIMFLFDRLTSLAHALNFIPQLHWDNALCVTLNN